MSNDNYTPSEIAQLQLDAANATKDALVTQFKAANTQAEAQFASNLDGVKKQIAALTTQMQAVQASVPVVQSSTPIIQAPIPTAEPSPISE